MSIPSESPDLFWKQIESTETQYEPTKPIVVDGKTLYPKAEDFQKEMFQACDKADDLLSLFLQNKPTPSRVLDLGSGNGVNSLELALRNIYVCAIDVDGDLLSLFAKRAKKHDSSLRLRCCDLNRLESFKEYDKTFDLVIGMDILPYILPKDLKSVMEKIKECVSPGGYFVGSFFTTDDTYPKLVDFMSQVGAHFYPGGRKFVKTILEHSDFNIETLHTREESGISFIARKKIA